MKYLFVPYHLAVLARDNGFDEKCLATFERKDYGLEEVSEEPVLENHNSELYECDAPLYQQLVHWFRKKYNIHIHCSYLYGSASVEYWYFMCDANNSMKQIQCDTMIEALERAFKLIQNG